MNLDLLLCEAREAALGIEHFRRYILGLHPTPQVIQIFAVEQYFVVNIFDR